MTLILEAGEYTSPNEAAEMIGVSKPRVQALMREGRIRYYQSGRIILIPIEEVARIRIERTERQLAVWEKSEAGHDR